MTFTTNLYKKVGGKFIPGQLFRGLVWFKDNYVYENLRVYADKTIASDYLIYNLPIERKYKHVHKYNPWMKKEQMKGMLGGTINENISAIPFDDFKYLLTKKLVTFNYKGQVKLQMWEEPYTNFEDRFYLINFSENVSNEEYIKTLEDVFCKLNGKPTNERLVLNALCEFLQAPKDKKEIFRDRLHKAYLNVPKFQRPNIYAFTIEMQEKALSKTPVEDIIFKRKNRLDNYEDFVKVYDDGYFEAKYRELAKQYIKDNKNLVITALNNVK